MGFLSRFFNRPKKINFDNSLNKFLVLLDTNYVKRLQETFKNPSGVINFPRDLLEGSKYNIGISARILDELVRSKKDGNEGLVGIDTLNEVAGKYKIHFLHAREISKERAEYIRSLWSRHSPKGKIESRLQKNRKKFIKSGDVELLSIAIDRGQKPTIILSDDKDIHTIGEALRRNNRARIYVYTYKQFNGW